MKYYIHSDNNGHYLDQQLTSSSFGHAHVIDDKCRGRVGSYSSVTGTSVNSSYDSREPTGGSSDYPEIVQDIINELQTDNDVPSESVAELLDRANKVFCALPGMELFWLLTQKPCVVKMALLCWLSDPFGNRWSKLIVPKRCIGRSSFFEAMHVLESKGWFSFKRECGEPDKRFNTRYLVINLHGAKRTDEPVSANTVDGFTNIKLSSANLDGISDKNPKNRQTQVSTRSSNQDPNINTTTRATGETEHKYSGSDKANVVAPKFENGNGNKDGYSEIKYELEHGEKSIKRDNDSTLSSSTASSNDKHHGKEDYSSDTYIDTNEDTDLLEYQHETNTAQGELHSNEGEEVTTLYKSLLDHVHLVEDEPLSECSNDNEYSNENGGSNQATVNEYEANKESNHKSSYSNNHQCDDGGATSSKLSDKPKPILKTDSRHHRNRAASTKAVSNSGTSSYTENNNAETHNGDDTVSSYSGDDGEERIELVKEAIEPEKFNEYLRDRIALNDDVSTETLRNACDAVLENKAKSNARKPAGLLVTAIRQKWEPFSVIHREKPPSKELEEWYPQAVAKGIVIDDGTPLRHLPKFSGEIHVRVRSIFEDMPCDLVSWTYVRDNEHLYINDDGGHTS